MDIQIEKAQKAPTKMNQNRSTCRHIVVKLSKDKEKLLKAARHKCRELP